ncbi:isoprenyl transferase [Streptomyces californicus]
MAVGYGGRREIVDAVKSALEHIAAGGGPGRTGRPVRDRRHLPRCTRPVADHTNFIIRTSAARSACSGFLLWQSAYAEMHWVDCYWPAFRHVDFLRALRW